MPESLSTLFELLKKTQSIATLLLAAGAATGFVFSTPSEAVTKLQVQNVALQRNDSILFSQINTAKSDLQLLLRLRCVKDSSDALTQSILNCKERGR